MAMGSVTPCLMAAMLREMTAGDGGGGAGESEGRNGLCGGAPEVKRGRYHGEEKSWIQSDLSRGRRIRHSLFDGGAAKRDSRRGWWRGWGEP